MFEKLIEAIDDFRGCEFLEQDGAGIIKNACLLGSMSRNGYEYSPEGMRRAVDTGLYNDLPVYVNHVAGNTARDVMHLSGQVQNPRFEGGKVRGDIRTLPDEFGRKVYNIARLMPGTCGFSHVANGRLVQRDGKKVVEEIEKVYSVDCVANPATTNGIYEGAVVEGDIPKPGPAERQIDFVPRCMGLIQHANPSIGSDQALAICFASWGSRFETGGTTSEDPLPIAPAPKKESIIEITTQGGTLPPERTTMTTESVNDRITRRIREREQTVEDAVNLLNPLGADIVREEMAEENHRKYMERVAQQKRDQERLKEISAAFDPNYRESDSEFWDRINGQRRMKEQVKRDAAQIAESVLDTSSLVEI